MNWAGDNLNTRKYGEVELSNRVYSECLRVIRDKYMLECVVRDWETGYEDNQIEAYNKLDSMHRALLEIPGEYRSAVIESIIGRETEFDEFIHENTLKKYKHKFIYNFAKNLELC